MTLEASIDAVILQTDGSFVSLVYECDGFNPPRRSLDAEPLRDVTARYRAICERMTLKQPEHAALLQLGRELYAWLDGKQGWLQALRENLRPPFIFEVRAGLHPNEAASALLQAPWELLADEHFLAGDAMLRFAPARRIGPPKKIASGDLRLGVIFMASAPRGVNELDYEAEEAAIFKAASQNIDLSVEDSGDLQELRKRLAALQGAGAYQALHLSCHGNNTPQPILQMENAAGEAVQVSPDSLISALGAAHPRLLFLSACLSAAAVPGGLTDSFAAKLVTGLPAVLGWDGSVADLAATTFAQKFYERLAERCSIVEAAAFARSSLLNEPIKEQTEPLRRDWHLARVWLGPSPLGGGAIVKGTDERSSVIPYHGKRTLAATKQGTHLEVAHESVFVGRRRELQNALRTLAGNEHAGVLLHGMGRLGKSSLAAHIADRRPDMRLAVVFDSYDALSVLDALEKALADHAPARALLKRRRAAVQNAINSGDALYEVLVDLLAGPCLKKPVLLLIDDLEQILQTPPNHNAHLTAPDRNAHLICKEVCKEERSTMSAILRAFDPLRTRSRLLITSRFPFSLSDGNTERTEHLQHIQLPGFSPSASRKLLLRQEAGAAASLKERLPLLPRTIELARDNPGLQDFLGNKVVLNGALTPARIQEVLDETAEYFAVGKLPNNEEARKFLEKLKIDELLTEAGDANKALLRAITIYDIPVPEQAIEALAGEIGGKPQRLQALGLLDPHEDADRRGKALAVNALAAGRLQPLADTEEKTIAASALYALLPVWGETDDDAQIISLTRLGLLAEDAAIVAKHAATAVGRLTQTYRIPEAVSYAQSSVALLEREGQTPSLHLLANAAEAFEINGDGDIAAQMLQKGNYLLTDDATELSDTSRFLFQLGGRQERSGNIHAAMETFEQLCTLERVRKNDRQLAVARSRIADILFTRGDLDEALRIRREDELPVYTRIGDIRSVAVTQGKIADILFARGDLDEALRIRREDELPVYTRIGDIREIALAQGKIADILFTRGDLDEALRIQREDALPAYTRICNIREIAFAQGKIADILFARGDLDEALRIRREDELPVYTRLGDIRSVAATQGKIADILFARGDLDEALRIQREDALPAYTRIGDIREIAFAQGKIADILFARGDLDEALRIRREDKLPVYTRIGDIRSVAVTQGQIADILFARGDLDEALRIQREDALPVYTRIGDIRSVAVTQGKIADILFARGDLDEALRILREDELPVYTRIGDIRSVALTQSKIADIFFARGDLDEAMRIRREEALPIFTRLGDIRERAVAQGKIADILFARGDLDEAMRIRLGDALPVFTRLGDIRSVAATQGKIADIFFARGDLDEALRIQREEVLPTLTRLGNIHQVAVTQRNIADILAARDDTAGGDRDK